jgi:hypothetical protein
VAEELFPTANAGVSDLALFEPLGSVCGPLIILTRGDALGRQSVAVVSDCERLVHSHSAVDEQVIQVDHTPRAVVVSLFLRVVWVVLVGDVDLMAVGRVVGEFVDGIGLRVSLDDEPERRVGPAEFNEPSLPEPSTRIDDGEVDQAVTFIGRSPPGCGLVDATP